ncbi:MAG: phosphate/phosphite/phosphonate ABC transporter substrate-binding protein [Pseudonocardiaceae bacterium]
MVRPAHRAVVALVAVAALLITPGCIQNAASGGVGGNSSDPHVLVFAAVPSARFASLQQDHQPVIDLLEKETGMKVRFETGTDYAAILQELREGKIDIASLSPSTYVLAKQQDAPITVVAARVRQKGKVPEYQSYGITWAGSPIKTLADFRGKRICFVDPKSTSGYLYPRIALRALGIEPGTETMQIFVGQHDAVVLAVSNHQCDAGFALDRVVDRDLIAQGRLEPGQIVTVWKSGAIPGPPLVISDRLPLALRQQLTATLQSKANADYLRANGFCQGECAIADGDAYGYQPADDAFYNGIREICKSLQNDPCTEG